MYGSPDATLLALSAAPVDQSVINALQASAAKLGHATGACVATLEEAGADVARFVAAADPWSVLALDDEAACALRQAFAPAADALAPDAPVCVPAGYTLVAVPAFASCLDDQQAKRVAWARMKAARHPGNPLERH